MTNHVYKNILCKIVFDDSKQERKSWACFGQTCSRPLSVFLSQVFVFLLIIFGYFCRNHLAKTHDECTVWLQILCSAVGYFFTLTKTMNKVIPTKNCVFSSLVSLSETGKSQFVYTWLRNETFQPKFDGICFFINTLRHFLILCKKRSEVSSLFKE